MLQIKYSLCKYLTAFGVAMTCSFNANAYVECALSPASVYADNGSIWITWNSGGSGMAPLTDAAAKFYFATGLTAVSTGKIVRARFADGTSCTASGAQLIGLWLG
ncbi:hypothetical protein [Roseateles chitosanitabidus]|uniref:hypothetical protein n=1 Tax=Roseateles chitosanitabidus TaxID=65048 RepID=UPI001B21AE87|nr:hypothetical protein [Roseateles chitosanitabidus]MBO9687103.1 hypothetical protein [Roseateles chitosanitabidus]